MAAVQQRVLNWLYSVLMSEYRDVNRTYNDVAQTLSHYSSLSPRTDVYTFENGSSALLLHLSGTLPVNFRGTTYRFPIAVWVPHGYPHEAPLVYVTPTEGMVVRAGQHVDPQGKVYHPYLVGWAEFWDKSNLLDFLVILREVFAKEPPVIARQQQNAPPRPTPPPVPPPPSMERPHGMTSPTNIAQPPPPPPKPNQTSQSYSPGPSRRDTGPPLPPLPGQDRHQYGPPIPQLPNGQYHQPQRSSSLRYENAPQLPPQPHIQQNPRDSTYSPVSPLTPEAQHRGLNYNQIPPGQYVPQQPPYQQPHGQNIPPSYMQPPQQQPQHYVQYQQAPPAKPVPPPDLLDGPLTLPIPTTPQNIPPPPIPTNPEKDHLLQNIGKALQEQRQRTHQQTVSSLPGLQSQHKAMLTTLQNMQNEISALESLSATLQSNTTILHTALRDADGVIESSQHRAPPGIDDILVAPTVVGNQLYELVSEERSLGDALFVLGRAVERGRISPVVFAKMTRALAREWYLKKALVKKIGKGMGLDTAIY
ncbi:UEV domain-containing protein [Phlyctema vagabunda]|uniref:UEV domain-containing protein n=1 Tax=Phlyctema vagabunda TaxID=108571 RepID=A0ABR4PGW3_9HELO